MNGRQKQAVQLLVFGPVGRHFMGFPPHGETRAEGAVRFALATAATGHAVIALALKLVGGGGAESEEFDSGNGDRRGGGGIVRRGRPRIFSFIASSSEVGDGFENIRRCILQNDFPKVFSVEVHLVFSRPSLVLIEPSKVSAVASTDREIRTRQPTVTAPLLVHSPNSPEKRDQSMFLRAIGMLGVVACRDLLFRRARHSCVSGTEVGIEVEFDFLVDFFYRFFQLF